MGDICTVCFIRLTQYDDAIICTGPCKGKMHIKCGKLTPANLTDLRINDLVDEWICEPCKLKKTTIASKKSCPPTLDLIYEEIKSLREGMEKSFNFIHERLEELNGKFKLQEEKLTQYAEVVEDLRLNNASLKRENKELNDKLNKTEQRNLMNTIEVIGIPEARDEDLVQVVTTIGGHLGEKIDPSMIDDVYRKKKNVNKPNEPRVLAIRFVRAIDKDRFMKAKKVKKHIKTHDMRESLPILNMSVSRPVYVNEALTPNNRLLFNKAKEFRAKNNVKYLWIKNGRILMKKDDGARVFGISSVEDFRQIT